MINLARRAPQILTKITLFHIFFSFASQSDFVLNWRWQSYFANTTYFIIHILDPCIFFCMPKFHGQQFNFIYIYIYIYTFQGTSNFSHHEWLITCFVVSTPEQFCLLRLIQSGVAQSVYCKTGHLMHFTYSYLLSPIFGPKFSNFNSPYIGLHTMAGLSNLNQLWATHPSARSKSGPYRAKLRGVL